MLKSALHGWPACLVFIAFAALFLVISFAGPSLASPFDPYYHLKHAQTYWSGEDMNMPVFSTMNSPGADLYVGYHLLIAPFTYFFNGSNYQALINGFKVFHAAAAALLFFAFYLIFKSILRDYVKKIKHSDAVKIALLATLFLFLISPGFTSRMLYQRPHVISTILLLLAFYFTLTKKHWLLFLTAAVSPLLYSISFVVLIPAFFYAACYHLYYRTPRLNYRVHAPLIYALLGLAAGIWLHPHSLHYIYNAYFVHILAVIRVYTEPMSLEGAELYAARNLHHEIAWLVALLFFFVHLYYARFIDKKMPCRVRMSFPKFYLLGLTLFFFILGIFIQRAIEYLIPFAVLLLAWAAADDLAPLIRKIVPPPRYLLLLPLAVFFLVETAYYSESIGSLPAYDQTRSAAEFIKNNSSPGDTVFHRRFSDYPRLVFFNSQNRYIMGMGAVFTYVHSPRKYLLYRHIAVEGRACFEKECSADNEISVYEAMRREFNASFVYYEKPGGENKEDEHEDKFFQALREDERFKKVYTDKNYPEIMVYSL